MGHSGLMRRTGGVAVICRSKSMAALAQHPATIPRALPYAMGIILLVTSSPGGTATAPAARFAKMDAAFGALPDWVMQWMGFQHFVFPGPVPIFMWHADVRIYLLAIFDSHPIVFGEIFIARSNGWGMALSASTNWCGPRRWYVWCSTLDAGKAHVLWPVISSGVVPAVFLAGDRCP